MGATVTSWSDLPQDHPMAKIARRRIMGEKMMVSQVHLSQGFDLPSHQHENEQFVLVVSGRCLFGLGAPGSAEHRTVEVRIVARRDQEQDDVRHAHEPVGDGERQEHQPSAHHPRARPWK